MKTLLIRPNCSGSYQKSVEQLRAIEMPLWLLCMANCYPDSQIIDAEAERLDRESLINLISRSEAERIVILTTGSHPSAHIQQKEETDKLITDLKYAGYMGTLERHDKLNFNPNQVGALNYKLLDLSKYRCHNWQAFGQNDTSYASIFSSISCPFNCQFCTIKSFYGAKYETRSIDDFVRDLHSLYDIYKIKNYKMMDELFAVNPARIKTIADQCEDLGEKINIWAYARIDTVTPEMLKDLRRMGVRWLAYGIETGNDEIRNVINKGSKITKEKIKDVIKMTRDVGIYSLGNYMFGFWDDTKATMEETLALAKELNCEFANFYATVAYPGSQLYEDMKTLGVDLPKNYRDYGQLAKTFKCLPTKTLSAQEVLKFRDEAFLEYFTDGRYLTHMKQTFGNNVIKDITTMLDARIERQ